MTDTSIVTLRQKLEALIVRELEKGLAGDQITGERAHEIANIVLEAVPEDVTDSELVKIIPTLDDKASELAPVVYKILSERDELERTKQLGQLRGMIRSMQNG
ncbi:hypothetical protein A3A70_03005 [candidate division WWE3 bacterium RIFCSPLOWO2_01_FULL_42_11]|uniref:Uncharacterized protein n=2 Tax=Bacteria candidate phyla TaxID=1783234 RepID=A0A1F4VSS8_UNCKA|nr:MAG: hypothetical protein A3A70_03005 [candidate division WWE3 bacterium RIFCSPLOWO2_01_FULL_42_11]OGG15295.1 MAG: hypothetical protein A2773_03100 [Candidatus Gottesmanbacteria bacterium RIFCSPHIGHO2_01_FULL_39_10]